MCLESTCHRGWVFPTPAGTLIPAAFSPWEGRGLPRSYRKVQAKDLRTKVCYSPNSRLKSAISPVFVQSMPAPTSWAKAIHPPVRLMMRNTQCLLAKTSACHSRPLEIGPFLAIYKRHPHPHKLPGQSRQFDALSLCTLDLQDLLTLASLGPCPPSPLILRTQR